MATTIVYADASDGVITSADASYANARAGTGTTLTAATTGTTGNVGQGFSTSTYTCYQFFVNFDLITAGIPSGTVATSASLSFNIRTDRSQTDFTLEARTKDWGSSLTTGDWVAGASLSGQQLLASISTSGISTTFTMTNYVSGTDKLLDAVNTALSGDGILRIVLCSDRQTNGNTPTQFEFLVLYLSEQSGTSVDPRISVTYPDVGHPTIRRFGLFNGTIPRIHGMEGAYIF